MEETAGGMGGTRVFENEVAPVRVQLMISDGPFAREENDSIRSGESIQIDFPNTTDDIIVYACLLITVPLLAYRTCVVHG